MAKNHLEHLWRRARLDEQRRRSVTKAVRCEPRIKPCSVTRSVEMPTPIGQAQWRASLGGKDKIVALAIANQPFKVSQQQRR
jgi:hypothetical protein